MVRHNSPLDIYPLGGLRKMLNDECTKVGGIRAWGRANEISAAHVSRVINGHALPGTKVLRALSLKESTVYLPTRWRTTSTVAADSADDVINAQHDETGRTWRGPRSQLPRRYFEITSICCLDYPLCDCNSPPEPDDDWLCFQRPAQPKVTP